MDLTSRSSLYVYHCALAFPSISGVSMKHQHEGVEPMPVRCADCGHSMSDDKAAEKITDIFPPLGTAGGGHPDWVSNFLANGFNRQAIPCPACTKTERWEGCW